MTHTPSAAPADGSPVEGRVLIVEDSEAARKQLRHLLAEDPALSVATAANGSEALQLLSERSYSIVVTDLKMPRVSGLELLEEIQKRGLSVAVVVTTGVGGVEEAVRAMRLGAADFLTKPIDVEHLRIVISRVLRERALLDEVALLREQMQERYSFHKIFSKSPSMHAVFELIGRVAETNTTVLIEGETGTGKELVAQAIHEASTRRDGPLVTVNCAALPETLLESELFGHEKGAFTSAAGQRKGRFELADGGTIFLDEVSEIPLTMQAKLLRVLQERRFERVGGTESLEVDVRVIAATNRALHQMAQEGKFREDLYYRLNVLKIDLPPLRDRREDIPLLAAHFAEKYSPPGSPPPQFTPETMELLLQHRWPGNIRELENAVERACVTAREGVIRPENLPPDLCKTEGVPSKLQLPVDLSRPLAEQLAEITAAFEERYLRKALRKARGHIGRTATITGLSRRSVSDKLALYKIDKDSFKKE
jgi:DNA-binding NtrC family response regulator